MSGNLLSIIIFLPLLATAGLLFVPAEKKKIFQYSTIAVTFIQLLLTVLIYVTFQSGEGSPSGISNAAGYQFAEQADWISLNLGTLGQLSIDYFVAVDGLSISMLLLAGIVMFIGAIASLKINQKIKGYFGLYLLLSATVMGCFTALDFFLFFLFFEFMLLPMYFLIGLWGGKRSDYASIKFFLYTLFGSVIILLVMIALYTSVIDPAETAVKMGLAGSEQNVTTEIIEQVQAELAAGTIAAENKVHSFNMVAMMDKANYAPGSLLSTIEGSTLLGMSARLMAFLLLFIGFAIKLPIVPLHTWLPDAHVEAPTPVSVVLAGILLKIGGYGMMRTAYSMFPEGGHHFAWWIALLAVITIIYGAYNALAQQDLKRLVAYSSVSHMGFVLLGLSAMTVEALNGSLFQMFSHGLIAAMLFLIAGVLDERTGDRTIENYSGLAAKMPFYTGMVVVAFFASLGLPGFSGFVAEVLVFLGAFSATAVFGLVPKWMVIVSLFGLLLGAAYFLWALQRMFFGQLWTRKEEVLSQMHDLKAREIFMLLPLAVLVLLFGIYPSLFLDVVSESMSRLAQHLDAIGTINLSQLLK
jgi:NADH-quinone oxidoreductase subunit M